MKDAKDTISKFFKDNTNYHGLKSLSYILAQTCSGVATTITAYNIEEDEDNNNTLLSPSTASLFSMGASIALASYSIFDVLSKRDAAQKEAKENNANQVELSHPNVSTRNTIMQIASEGLIMASQIVNDISPLTRALMAAGGGRSRNSISYYIKKCCGRGDSE